MAQLNDSTVNGNLNVTEDVTIGDMSVKEEISNLNSKFDELGCSSLLVNIKATTTETEFATYNNRKLSDYHLLVFQLKAGILDTRDFAIETVNGFSEGNLIHLLANHGTNYSSISGAVITYVSDTLVKVKLDGAAGLTIINIYGIKLK